MRNAALLSLSVLVFTQAATASQSAQDYSGAVIPTPRVVQRHDLPYRLASGTRIVLAEGCTAEDRFAAEYLLRALNELKPVSLKIAEEATIRKLGDGAIFIGPPRGVLARQLMAKRSLRLTADMKDEGFALDADQNGVVIVAESPAGRFYGVTTLIQLAGIDKKSIVVPGISIHDWPLQAMRGITDDLSRNQVSTMENFKKIIRMMARYKLNVYSPYIEDIVMFKSHPLIGRGRGSITPTELRELDAYARQFHVQMIPIFETLGHWENILSMPQYAGYAEFPGAHTLNVSDERVYTMLDAMIGELAACFRSPYFNMAADESWDVGLGANKERVARSDLASVHAEHYIRLFEILKKYKKKPMMYGDIILNNPPILEKIPKDVVIVDWHYGASDAYPSPETFRNAGFPFVVSPAVWNFTGPFPNYLNTFVNIRNLNRDGYANGSLGLLTSNWNDYGGEALRELNYYGYAWTAECAWNPLTADGSAFGERFFRDFFGTGGAVLPAQSVYAILSDPANLLNWHELWRHPFLPPRIVPMTSVMRVQSIMSTMPVARKQLEILGHTAVRNADHLDHLAFIMQTNDWFAQKLSFAEEVRRLAEKPVPGTEDSVRTRAARICETVVTQLEGLQKEFRRLWLMNNRQDNLEWLMKRYERQLAWWKEKQKELLQGQPWGEAELKSKFIYHGSANPRKRDTTAVQVPRTWFRKSFVLEDTTNSAMLQWIGDTHAKVWLNGRLLGESYVRTSLSLMIEYQRVRMVDVAPFLRKGENVIAVEAACYGPFASAGCNVYAEIGSLQVMSDSTWRVGTGAAEGWRMPGFDESEWTGAKVMPYPNAVTRPNFAERRSSWVER